MKGKSWIQMGALLAMVLAGAACDFPSPTDPNGGAGNGNGNGSGNGNGNNVTVNVIISGNVPGSGTGSGSTAGCAAIADIGGKLYGSVDTRGIALNVGQTASADFTPKDAQGKTRGGTCDIDTPVEFIVSDATVCQVIPNGPSPYVPSIKGLKAGTCTVKARAAGVTTSDDKAVRVTVS